MSEPLQRAIVHLDADAFFVSVEQSADPRLRGRPVAVGGERRGIIASASYEARKLGVYTPMPTALARRICPKLIVLPPDFEKYELFSRLMFSYAYDFTPDVEIGSIDEGYFDLSGVRKPAVGVAGTIRDAIRQSLKLPVSEGIATNKLVSQVASKLKKPSAFEFVPPGQERSFLAPLANQWLPGVGPVTAHQLTAAGLARIGQIAATPPDLLGLLVGSLAGPLHRFALGQDDRPVIPARAAAKSYGEQETFAADTTDEPFLDATLRRMADRLMAKVRAEGKSIRTVTVKVRYNDMDEEQAADSLTEPTDLETDLYPLVSQLLRKAWRRRVSLRLVSLRLSNVHAGALRSGLALTPEVARHDAEERLAGVIDKVRRQYGRQAVFRGHEFVLRRGQENAHRTARAKGRILPKEARPIAAPKAAENAAALRELPAAYSEAALKRQRIGNSAKLQVIVSPGVELRFRMDVPAGPVTRRRASCVPLNVHSFYSFLDSTLSIRELVAWAERHRLPAIALTDKNNLHGAVEFAHTAAAAGIKPIIGSELQWQGRRVCLYVENQTGYHNLCKILNSVTLRPISGASSPLPRRRGRSAAARVPFSPPAGRGFPSAETEDNRGELCFEALASDAFRNTEGLIAVSGATELAPFFPGRFYCEIANPKTLERGAPPLPCVAVMPVHYAQPGDRWKYDVVQSIRTLTLLRQAHPEKRLDGEYHFRPPAEMEKIFRSHPELLAHSVEIAERCSFDFGPGKPQFPAYSPRDGSTPAAFLRRLALEGLRRRYPREPGRYQPQVEQELAIITEVGYEEYFLVMWDILQECRRRGIDWITRGSAADSLVCYCLEISSVCPIRFDLYFRRFLNKERMALNKLPDIDVDFAHDRKDDVIDLIFEKFGTEHTAAVGGFSTFQSRSAFAEVAKVLGVSEYQVRRITERLPHFTRVSELPEVVASSLECRDLPLDQEPYSTALQMAQFLDGFPRYVKMHPCGIVLSRQPMREITPCFTSAKGYPTTQFDMDAVERVGLVKMDILAQGGLAAMRDVKAMLVERYTVARPDPGKTSAPSPADSGSASSCRLADTPGLKASHLDVTAPPFNLDALEPWNDPKVWDLIASGGARAVHHIESPAMISLCRMCNVRDIDTLIAIVSVIRPGAANESKKMEFARRYQGLSPTRYPHPSLEPCLRSTYGLVVYEEHILQICEAFAGLPPGRADVLRRALGKDKTEIIEQIRDEFIKCARQRGHTEAEIAEVWELVSGFKGYAFCKAHSTAYGVEAYQSAWLKRYYPAEFMAAVLSNGKGFYSPLVYILECHRLGIGLLPPSVNDPGPLFQVRNGKIRVPVLQVKGLTRRTKDQIVAEHSRGRFASLADFLFRVQPQPEEMDLLIRAGAFDDFGATRTAQYWEFKSLSPIMAEPGQSGTARQLWLLPPGNLERLPTVPLTEPDRQQRLRWEEELLGYPVSDHPLALYPDIAWETYCPINRLGRHIGQQVITCGLVIEQRTHHQVTGELMKFITIADRTGIVETELFARTYRSYGLNTVRYRVLEITATVEPFENGRGFTLRVHRATKPRQARPKT